jgi:hypothetical protein
LERQAEYSEEDFEEEIIRCFNAKTLIHGQLLPKRI